MKECKKKEKEMEVEINRKKGRERTGGKERDKQIMRE